MCKNIISTIIYIIISTEKYGSTKTQFVAYFTQCITVALFLKDKMDKENRLLKQKWIRRE